MWRTRKGREERPLHFFRDGKAQLISKGNFSVFNELENVNFFPSLLGQKFFVRFLGELKKTNVLSKLTDL